MPAGPALSGAATILIVDDDADVREMVVDYLSGQGFGVVEAADARSMRAVLADRSVDLVLLDRTMPDGDGIKLVPELRQGYRLPVIMLTALVAEEERVRGLDDGADDYVTKPFHWRELRSRIASVLRRSLAERVQLASAFGGRTPGIVRREQVAVLCADVAAYVRLMQDDEEATVRTWWLYRQTVIDPALAAYGGRIVKYTGDGFFAEFEAVEPALSAAVAIQTGVQRCNQTLPPPRRMRFRIAINWCSVVADGEDIYGDGVNLAARLQATAEPGGIWLAHAAYVRLEDAKAAFEPVGPLLLKHMADPVRAWRWTGGQIMGTGWQENDR